jgi:hypothetical protein
MLRKISLAGFVIGYCLVGAALLGLAQDKAADSAKQEWKRYDLGVGAFSVLLPDKPTDVPPSPDIAKDLGEFYVYSVTTDEAIFITTRAFLPEAAERWAAGADEPYYEGFWNGVAEGFDKQIEALNAPFKTKLLQKRKASLSGYDAHEFDFTIGAMQGRVLVARVGRHAFSAMILRPETTPAADLEKFFSSFTINQSWLNEHKPRQ